MSSTDGRLRRFIPLGLGLVACLALAYFLFSGESGFRGGKDDTDDPTVARPLAEEAADRMATESLPSDPRLAEDETGSTSEAPNAESGDAALELPADAVTTLDDPRAFVSDWAPRVSKAAPEDWSDEPDLLERLVAATNATALGENPMRHLRFVRPGPRFEPDRLADGTAYLGHAARQRYAPFVRAISSLDARVAAQAFGLAEAYLDRVQRSLGHPDGKLREGLIEAIETLLATPRAKEPIELVPDSVTYRYADEDLEALEPAQKLLLRLSPTDRDRVQGKLEALRQALSSGSSGSSEDGA